MSPQLSLLDPCAERTSNLFFAFFPDTEMAAHLSGFAKQIGAQHGLIGKALEAERLHVSLHHLGNYEGEVPKSVLAMARRAAASLALPSFDITFDRADSFSGQKDKRPLVLCSREGNVALKAFQRTLGQALASAGLGRWVKAAYTPHLTLLYDEKTIPAGDVATVSWSAQELVLVRSLIGESHYDRLDSWPLRGPIP